MKTIVLFMRHLIGRFFRWMHPELKTRLAKNDLGEAGEKHAAHFLKNNGYKIIARNVRFSIGEIDIIAQIQRTIVFIEVKTRHSAQYCHPVEAVDKKKRQKIKQMALQFYRSKKYAANGFAIRFDIITLIWPEGEQPKIEHFVDAFR
jgi:putative endonuclease